VSIPRITALAAALGATACTTALGAAWGVGPLRVDLDRGVRSGIVNISNDDTTRLNFEIRLMRWSQAEDGTDRYEPSDELVYFPRVASVEPNEKRVVRVGLKGEASAATERTYRLFIEEMPDPLAPKQPGVGVAVKARFAIPVFVAAPQAQPKVELAGVTVERGEVRARLRNSGSQHLKIESVALHSGGVVVKEGNPWYVLPGATRSFNIPVTIEECTRNPRVTVLLKAESQEFRQDVALDPARCAK
jgi:fimbrial chaperone protein